jgi:hypothetical protein
MTAADRVSNILTEDVLSISQARDELAEIMGKEINKVTVWRWLKDGCRGVKLEGVRMGEQWFTSRQALTRFITERSK